MSPSPVRRLSRVLAVTFGIALGGLAGPAFAAAPSSWEDPGTTSTLHYLMLFFGIPLAITAVIFLLTYLPSMMKRKDAEPGTVFQERKEWFGGPRKAPDEAQSGETESTGGAGARW